MSDALDTAYVEIEADFSDFNRSVEAGVRNASRVLESRIRSTLANTERQFGSFGRGVSSTTEDAFREMARDADEAADDIIDSIDRVSGQRVRLDVDVDREGTFSRFLSSITGVRLPVAGFTALGAAAASAAGAVVQLGAALAPAAGIVAGLPAAVGVGAAAIGTLQVATAGFSDAMAAAFEDTENFEAAIEGLSPNAQAAAESFRAIVPELQALQDSVQDAFFREFDDIITNVADSLLGPLSDGMRVAAEESGDLVAALLNVAGSDAGVGFVTSSFETLNGILSQLQQPVSDLFTAFLDLGTAINTTFGGEEAGAGLAALIQQFADFISEATASGQAVQWVENALAVFSALGDILAPIVGVFSTIGSVAADTGGNILGVFGEALQAFDDFLSSAAGTETLVTIFETLNEVGAAFGDVLAGIGPALPSIISGISGLVSAVAPLIAPLAELVGRLLVALSPILDAVADAVEPLIGPLIEIAEIIGDALVGAIEAFLPWIDVLLELFSGQLAVILEIVGALLAALAPILEALLPLIEPLIQVLMPFIALFQQLADILLALLIPVIEVLAEILLWLVDTVIVPVLVPTLEFLAEIFSVLLKGAIQDFVNFFITTGELLVAAFNLLRDAWDVSVQNIQTMWDGLTTALETAKNFIVNNVFGPIRTGIGNVRDFIDGVLEDIEDGWDSFISFLGGLPRRVGSAVSGLWDGLWEGFRSAINSIIDGWNGLSFSVPSVDLGPLGDFGGFTISTPNIPRLQVGGMSMGEGLAFLDPNEAILPLEDSRTESLLAGAIRQAMSGLDAANLGADANGIGDVFIDVRIGETPLNDIVDTRIDVNNRNMVRRARTGTRRNL